MVLSLLLFACWYPGGLKEVPAEEMVRKHPGRMIELAVKGMLPKGPLGRQMARKLKVYAGAQHPHAAQRPQSLAVVGASWSSTMFFSCGRRGRTTVCSSSPVCSGWVGDRPL